jgi:hypothetical protein
VKALWAFGENRGEEGVRAPGEEGVKNASCSDAGEKGEYGVQGYENDLGEVGRGRSVKSTDDLRDDKNRGVAGESDPELGRLWLIRVRGKEVRRCCSN